MDRVERELVEVTELIRVVKPAEAERRLRSLITTLGAKELQLEEPELRGTIAKFLKKRKRALDELLTKALAADQAAEKAAANAAVPKIRVEAPPTRRKTLETELAETLRTLGEKHIFQWGTFYRDALAPLVQRLVRAEADFLRDVQDPISPTVHALVAAHAYSIAGQGYEFTLRSDASKSQSSAIRKTLVGLQRFLELPIEFYAAFSTSVTTASGAVALRRLTSAFLSGIIEGYGSVKYGNQEGWHALSREPKSWAHYAGFLTTEDLAAVADGLEEGVLRNGLVMSVNPAVHAIDELVRERRLDYSGLPAFGQLDWEAKRLIIALEGSSRGVGARLIEIQCYLDPAAVQVQSLEEASSRNVALIVAPLRADVSDWVASHDRLRQMVLNTSPSSVDPVRAAQRAKDALELAVAIDYGVKGADSPLAYNFARDFPLHNPFLTRFFHVVRPSVRALLGRFEFQNGVRLWCSVRRSGKTTACFDLSTTTGRSTVVSQTCDRTGQQQDADLFCQIVVQALTDGGQIPDAFFRAAVERCSPPRRPTEIRFVFALDEYETLFERMRHAVQRNPELRYTVIQPLLNQMVTFTSDNLLVFIGQRPDAHFLFMDQNQLSAYVQQDAFPLFEHKTGSTEFSELLRKIASERVPFEMAFADALYSETAGHPFLTVKVMIDFFDWLIKQERSLRALQLTRSDFESFRSEWLTPQRLCTSPEYQFFAHAISEALSTEGRVNTPWLHAIYSALQRVATDNPTSLRCNRSDFSRLVTDLRLSEELGYTPDQLLGTGAQANFFGYSTSDVWVRVPVLGRIASGVRPRLSW